MEWYFSMLSNESCKINSNGPLESEVALVAGTVLAQSKANIYLL